MLQKDCGKVEILLQDGVCGKRGESKTLLQQGRISENQHFLREPSPDPY